MAKVDPDRLKGNYGAALLSVRLSSECLVRPVVGDTDIGVDLYCESVEEDESFLHFWVQVKTGTQCHVDQSSGQASCRFESKHLEYWFRQPVPVFAALVPVAWPVKEEPSVYIIDVTSHLIFNGLPQQQTVTLYSNIVWPPSNNAAVRDFLKDVVPQSTARLLCKKGVIPPAPTARTQYIQTVPFVPASQYSTEILTQLRQTAAMAIISMWKQGHLSGNHKDHRKLLEGTLMPFKDVRHWENRMAIALSAHADCEWFTAIYYYQSAISAITGDTQFSSQPRVCDLVSDINAQLEKARNHQNV